MKIHHAPHGRQAQAASHTLPRDRPLYAWEKGLSTSVSEIAGWNAAALFERANLGAFAHLPPSAAAEAIVKSLGVAYPVAVEKAGRPAVDPDGDYEQLVTKALAEGIRGAL